MIYVGTDIVKVSRISQIISDHRERFLSRIFTHHEQSICNAKASPHIHYSGRFAAKEAIKKALLSSKRKKYIALNAIEIQNTHDGVPIVHINDNTGCVGNIQVSISHTDEYATAAAILEI